MSLDSDDQSLVRNLLTDLLYFTKVFYKLRTGNDFVVINPVGRRPRQEIISESLTDTVRNGLKRLVINIQPGAGKSELLIHYVAWCLAQYPDSNFLYLSHTKSLSEKHTSTIRQIITLPVYQHLFGVSLRKDSTAKSFFTTIQGGTVAAFGSGGAVTGQDAGRPNLDRFAGALIYDDAHKPSEVHSDTMRENIIDNFRATVKPRLRSPITPIIYIGQRLHEADICNYFLSGQEGHHWNSVILKSLDDAGNDLCPDIISKEDLLKEKEFSPYEFASQYQQNPVPAGGGLFKSEWFPSLTVMPEILGTFITCDTAETSKQYNDATVFSFWGFFNIQYENVETEQKGLVWLDCLETRIEPKDLKYEFDQFYAACMRFHVKPSFAAIEKKSTGTTLVSVLKEIPGMRIVEIERTRASGSKTDRFIKAQSFIASKRIVFVDGMRHANMCIEHMSKITANDTHRFDDIADTCADAIQLGLVDKLNMVDNSAEENRRKNEQAFKSAFDKRNRLLDRQYR